MLFTETSLRQIYFDFDYCSEVEQIVGRYFSNLFVDVFTCCRYFPDYRSLTNSFAISLDILRYLQVPWEIGLGRCSKTRKYFMRADVGMFLTKTGLCSEITGRNVGRYVARAFSNLQSVIIVLLGRTWVYNIESTCSMAVAALVYDTKC